MGNFPGTVTAVIITESYGKTGKISGYTAEMLWHPRRDAPRCDGKVQLGSQHCIVEEGTSHSFLGPEQRGRGAAQPPPGSEEGVLVLIVGRAEAPAPSPNLPALCQICYRKEWLVLRIFLSLLTSSMDKILQKGMEENFFKYCLSEGQLFL